MLRNIVKIDEELCNGCGACAGACHEGAIIMVDGKAKLMRDDYCDGLGACLPSCPTGAITIEERDAKEFDEEAVKIHMETLHSKKGQGSGCPGAMAKALQPQATSCQDIPALTESRASQLTQWPVQIQLVPVNAPYFEGARLLIAADCSAYAFANFHETYIKDHITLIGCPKLDPVDYSEKLTMILKNNQIKSVKIVRMEVPCCGGIEHAAVTALQNCGKMIPWSVDTISCDGYLLK